MKKNQIEITYIINAGIPFKWECKVKDESIIKYIDKYVSKDENTNAQTGAPVHINYIFEGLKEGKTIITFQYVNFADNEVWEEEHYIATVNKNKKIEIQKKES